MDDMKSIVRGSIAWSVSLNADATVDQMRTAIDPSRIERVLFFTYIQLPLNIKVSL
jgi:hypothetical protein